MLVLMLVIVIELFARHEQDWIKNEDED